MKINSVSTYPHNINYRAAYTPVSIPKTQTNPVSSPKKNDKNSLYKHAFIGLAAIGVATVATIAVKKKISQKQISEYSKTLAQSLSEHLDKKVKPEQLSSVISGKELLNDLKGLTKENYIASKENIEKGIFRADLHSHSNYSDGHGTVKNILDQVSQYADTLHQKTGKKFIYALTDHDSVEGVKEALTIISENPKKYKNVKFVTGAEMSFAIKADKTGNAYETIETLVYGMNPFDKKINSYMSGIQNRRQAATKKYIQDLNQRFGYADFSYEEFATTYLPNKNNIPANNQWRVHHYGQTKNAIAGLANSRGINKSELYEDIMSQTDASHKALGNLRNLGLVPQSYGDDSNITKLCKEVYSPHKNPDGTFNPSGENKFEDIVEVFKGNDDTFMAFAHPYYITERTSKSKELIEDLIDKSNGMLKGTEAYHQAYKNADMNNVEKLNNHISTTHNLIPLGGRDNHNVNWLF